MKLYEITDAYLSLDEAEKTEEIIKVLDGIKDEFDKKAENTVKVIRNFEADIQALRDEEKRLADKRRSLEKKKKDLKEYLYFNMERLNLRKVNAGIFDINIQKNPQSIKILDEATIPDKYKIASYRIDKKTLKDDIKNGVEIEGAQLVQTEGIRIRWVYMRNY